MRMRLLAACTATGVSIALGVSGKLAPQAAGWPAADKGASVLAWAADRGFESRAAHDLTVGGTYRAWLVEHPVSGCGLMIVPIEAAEEILPLLREALPPEAWHGALLWLGGLQPWPDSVLAIHLRRLRHRLAHGGAAPLPALVAGAPGCLEPLAQAQRPGSGR
jgi:hypothetical protein